ncbi:MAG: tetratricopeptide repeat protein [Nitrospinae bacterium]|nr:tetratricopeptide repeat protein [Nitrospinota bacterium]
MKDEDQTGKEQSGDPGDTHRPGTPEEEGLAEDQAPARVEDAEPGEEEAGEEVEFDLDAQIAEFRRQIEEDPGNCVHYYNLGEALADLGDLETANQEFENALQRDADGSFGAIIHFGIGGLRFRQLMRGISSNVVKSSVGLMSSHKDKASITDVNEEEYEAPIREFEMAIRDLPKLKADEEIVDYVSKNAPLQIAGGYYKWASDLIDKSRQLTDYGGEIRDVQKAVQLLRKTVEIDPNYSAAHLLLKVAKKMLTEGWRIFDDNGFLAKEIRGLD